MPVLALFLALGTQWRTSLGGPTGLDYTVLDGVMGRSLLRHIPRADWDDAFDDLRVLERAALTKMRQ